MSTMGKLEGRITVPTGGWDTTVGAGTATIAAGTYYLSSAGSGASDFLQTVADAFATAASTTCDITASLGENGTGIVTITFGSAKAITWIDTGVRDILGFTGDSASATSHVGALSARSVWLPSCHFRAPDVPGTNFKGLPFADTRMVMNTAGYAWHVAGQMNYQLPIEWPAVTAAKTRITQESTTHTSFERFWRDHIFGSASWGHPGGPVRFYPNAATDSTYVEYRVMEPLGSYEPQPLLEGLPTGPHRVALRLLAVGDDPFASTRLTLGVTSLAASSSTTDATSIDTASVSPAANAAIYACVVHQATSVTTPTCSGNGLTWVQVTTKTFATSRRLTVFRAMGASPSAGAITFDFAGQTQSSFCWSIVQCTSADTSGTNASGATVQSTSASGTGLTTINATLSALENSKNVHLSFCALQATDSVTVDPQFTELSDVSVSTTGLTLETAYAENQTTCDPTFSSAACAIISIEVKAG